MTIESNIHPLGIVEIGASIIIQKMRDVEILVGKIIYPDKIRIAQEIVKNTLRELLSRRDSRGTLDLFEENKDEETRFIARISKLSDNQATQVLRQIGDYINATIITREVVQKIRTEKLRNALRVEGYDDQDTHIRLLIEAGKNILKSSIIPSIDVESGHGYYQLRDELWKNNRDHSLREIFGREKIYHMSLDIAELFMKRYLPRISPSGQKFRSHGLRKQYKRGVAA